MDSKQEQISKGQALNIAYEIALKEGKALDNKVIITHFLKVFKLIRAVQSNTIEDLEKQLGK